MDKKAEIITAARALFTANGYKDTSVSDITKQAGIATGTFYLYYPSKDQVFMEIFLEENVKLKEQIMAAVDPDGEPMVVMQDILGRNMRGMLENPILREWYNRDVFQKIEQNYRAENGLQQVDFIYSSFIDFVRRWQAQGKMRADIDAAMIMAMFAAVINIDTHKEEIGVQFFPELLLHLADFVMQGLTGPAARA